MADQIISRAEAKAQGLKRYFTGEPCKNGHIAQRNVRDYMCSACAKDYVRNHRLAHLDRERENRRKWRKNNPDKLSAARAREYRAKQARLKALGPKKLKRAEVAGVIISRDEARAQGLRWYYTGKPCVNGHDAQRYVSNQGCVECGLLKIRKTPWTKEAAERRVRNADLRRQARTEGLKTYSTGEPCKHGHMAARSVEEGKCLECLRLRGSAAWKRWTEQNAEKRNVSQAQWKAANADKLRESNRKSRERNKAKYKPKQREYWIKNKEKLTDRWKKYYRDRHEYHLERSRIKGHARRAQINGSGGTHTPADLKSILIAQGHKCANCGADLRKVEKHVDHIMPLYLGGSNDKKNIQYLCATCNYRKGHKDPIDFAQEQGRLL